MQSPQKTHNGHAQLAIGRRVRLPSGALAIVVDSPREFSGRVRVDLRYLRKGGGEVTLPVELVQPWR